MGKGIRYNDELKQDAVNQVVLHGYSVSQRSGEMMRLTCVLRRLVLSMG
ncbi:hypothetical protein [Arenicella sp. 4NH20-0111]